MPLTDGDHKKLLTEVIKKQIVILGPDITLAKARNVKGMTIDNEGNVTNLTGAPQEITRQLIEQFMELSGLIVKKTMEPLLANFPNLVGVPSTTPAPATDTPQPPALQTPVNTPSIEPIPALSTPTPVVTTPLPANDPQNAINAALNQANNSPAPQITLNSAPPVPQTSPVEPEPVNPPTAKSIDNVAG